MSCNRWILSSDAITRGEFLSFIFLDIMSTKVNRRFVNEMSFRKILASFFHREFKKNAVWRSDILSQGMNHRETNSYLKIKNGSNTWKTTDSKRPNKSAACAIQRQKYDVVYKVWQNLAQGHKYNTYNEDWTWILLVTAKQSEETKWGACNTLSRNSQLVSHQLLH